VFVPVLLPRAGLLWSVPVLAPLLGLIGLAPAYVALAGLAPTARRRAGLAAAGVIWLLAAEAITGKMLLFGPPDGTRPRGGWEASASSAAHGAISPILTSPAFAPALVFAAFAALLPIFLRGRSLALDALGAGIWAVALASSLSALPSALPSLPHPRGAVAGALVGAALVVAAREGGLLPAPGRRSTLP
jgi:hypothetical protein